VKINSVYLALSFLLWLKEHYIFNETGKYKLTVEQAVRALGEVEGVPALQGVSEVGLRIEKAE